MNFMHKELSKKDRETVLEIARQSILHGLSTARPLPVKLAGFSEPLREKRASFVTLNKNGQLRGCIGALEAKRPLVEDIAENAFSAAFRDSRFTPVTVDEMQRLGIHISILNEPQPIECTSEQDLLQQLNPGVDGLILIEGHHRGTFLPSVWESLPHPRDFLNQLKHKAGLSKHYWSDQIKFLRYQTESFEDNR